MNESKAVRISEQKEMLDSTIDFKDAKHSSLLPQANRDIQYSHIT